MRRLRLLSNNGILMEGSVIQLTGYDHGVQHVAGGLGAFAETGTGDFSRVFPYAQPLTAPATMPLMIWLLKAKYSTTIGLMVISIAVIWSG